MTDFESAARLLAENYLNQLTGLEVTTMLECMRLEEDDQLVVSFTYFADQFLYFCRYRKSGVIEQSLMLLVPCSRCEDAPHRVPITTAIDLFTPAPCLTP